MKRRVTPSGKSTRIIRYPDGCYAVARGKLRGPCAHDKATARTRHRRSGLIALAHTDSSSTWSKLRQPRTPR